MEYEYALERARAGLSEAEFLDEQSSGRALSLGERLGGHLVQGHVDGVAQVLSATSDIALDGIAPLPQVESVNVTVSGP